MTVGVDVAVPSEFFVVLTRDIHPAARHNINLGWLMSAGAALAEADPVTYLEQRDRWLPWVPNAEFATFVGFHSQRITSEIRAEYHAELIRIEEFSSLPSRMACVYAWASLDDAQAARERMGGRFQGEIVRCIPDIVLRAARCNSSLFNFAVRAERGGFFTDEEAIKSVWRAYYGGSSENLVFERQNILDPQGEPERVGMSADPLWEWLIDGRLRIVDRSV